MKWVERGIWGVKHSNHMLIPMLIQHVNSNTFEYVITLISDFDTLSST